MNKQKFLREKLETVKHKNANGKSIWRNFIVLKTYHFKPDPLLFPYFSFMFCCFLVSSKFSFCVLPKNCSWQKQVVLRKLFQPKYVSTLFTKMRETKTSVVYTCFCSTDKIVDTPSQRDQWRWSTPNFHKFKHSPHKRLFSYLFL